MNTKILIFLLSSVILLSGCSTLSKTDCLATDWEQVGFEDGKAGIGNSAASNYLQSCSKHDVGVDMNAYAQGRDKGAVLFCQPENGFELGKQGHKYSVNCPVAFDEEYKIGYEFYVVYNNISQVENALITNTSNISQLQSGINSATIRLANDDLPVSEEHQLRQNIESMTGQIQGYEQNNQRLKPAVQQLQQQLEKLKSLHDR